MKPNQEEEYPVFFHLIHPAEIRQISVFGDIELSYFGFGDESKNDLSEFQENKCTITNTNLLALHINHALCKYKQAKKPVLQWN